MEINSWCYNYFLSLKWILRLLYIYFSDLYRSDHYWKNKNDVDALTIKINVRIRCLYKHLILMMCEYGVHSHSDPRPHTVPLLQDARLHGTTHIPTLKMSPLPPAPHLFITSNHKHRQRRTVECSCRPPCNVPTLIKTTKFAHFNFAWNTFCFPSQVSLISSVCRAACALVLNNNFFATFIISILTFSFGH